MSKVKCLCNVRESVMLAPGVFSLWIDAPEIAESAAPGQFVSIYTKNFRNFLPVIRLRCLALWEMDSRFRKRKQS